MNKNNISDIAALKRGSIFQQPNRKRISKLKSYNFRFQNIDLSQSIASQKLQSIERSLDQTQDEVVKSYLQTDSQRKSRSQQKCVSDVRINRIFTPNLSSSDVVPIWLQQRKDYLKMCYSQKIQNFLHIPKICLKQSRTYTEIANLKEWIMNQKSLIGFPNEFYDKFIKCLKTYVINQGEIVQLGEKKLIVYSGILEYKKKVFLSGDILQQENLNAVGKQDSILLGLDYQDLNIILDQIRKNQSEQFINKLKISRIFQMMEKYEIHKMVGRGIFVMYFKDEILNVDDESLLIIFSGSVQMKLSSYINKANRWPVGSNAWEIKQCIQNHHKIFILKECQCMSYNSSDNEKYIALENTLILSIQKRELEEISTQETILQISQQIQQQFQDSTNWKQKVRKRFNEELQMKKQQLQKVMKQLLEESCPSDLN